MKLHFAAFLKGQRLMNKDPAKSLYPIDDDGVKIQSLMTFLRSCSCCNDKKKKDRCGSCVALGEWTNIPRDMMMEYHGNDVWSTNLGKHRGEINGDTVPSFYVDGGKRNHKKEPEVQFTIVVGTVIYIRPAVSKRADENMHILEFRAVEVIDVDAGIIFPPSPSSSSVVSFEFDDEIIINNNNNNNNTNTLVVVKQEASDDVPTVEEQERTGIGFSDDEIDNNKVPTVVVLSWEDILSDIGLSPITNTHHSSSQEGSADDKDLIFPSDTPPRPSHRSPFDPYPIVN